jgi:hypothetical protein
VVENKVLRRIFGYKREEVTGGKSHLSLKGTTRSKDVSE